MQHNRVTRRARVHGAGLLACLHRRLSGGCRHGCPDRRCVGDSPTPTGDLLPYSRSMWAGSRRRWQQRGCAAAGSCTAVGQYLDTIGITHAMASTCTSASGPRANPCSNRRPGLHIRGPQRSVAVSASETASAVGDYRVSTVQTEGFYESRPQESGHVGIRLPLPADAASILPRQRSWPCPVLPEVRSATSSGVHERPTPFIRSLTPTPGAPDLPGPLEEISQSVGEHGMALGRSSCPVANDCVAVGAQSGSFSEVATYVEDNSGVWEIQ